MAKTKRSRGSRALHQEREARQERNKARRNAGTNWQRLLYLSLRKAGTASQDAMAHVQRVTTARAEHNKKRKRGFLR